MTQNSEERRQRKHDRQKQLLLAAASRLFAQQGYNSVTVRRIAEEADCSQGTLYGYFADKADILKHLCEETFTRLGKSLDEVEERRLSPRECLLEASRVFAEFCIGNPHHFKVFLMASTDFGDEKAVEFIGRMGIESFHRLRRIYEAVGFHVESPMGSFAWWNGLSGVVSFVNLHRERPWFDGKRLIAVCLETMLQGHERAQPSA